MILDSRASFASPQELPFYQKNPRTHKNKIGTSPPPPNPKYPPPPKTRNFMDMAFPAERTQFFPGVHKIGAAISGPRIADTNFTDTRIFLILNKPQEFPCKALRNLLAALISNPHPHPSPKSTKSTSLYYPKEVRKILVSVKFVSAILGPETAAPILWTPGKDASVLQEKPCP